MSQILYWYRLRRRAPGSSAGKESTCNAADPGLIPGLGRFPGERLGYPLQYLWASLVAQLVENPPAMWEIWVLSLGWGDPLEEGMATRSSILAWRIPMDRGAWRPAVHGVAKSQTWLRTKDMHMCTEEKGTVVSERGWERLRLKGWGQGPPEVW